MPQLYYPLSSKDFTFENIFSTESISPPSFYRIRGFGIGYFSVIPNLNQFDALILFRTPPKYDISDGIKFILEVDIKTLDLENLQPLQDGVYAYTKTIYLTKNNFRLLFFSDKDKKITILKSRNSLPTKNVDKYENNFIVVDETYFLSYNYHLEFKAISENETYYLSQDKKFNHFKGFIYGLVVGLYNKKSKEEIELNKTIRSIVNSFAEIKNRLGEYKYFTVSNKVNFASSTTALFNTLNDAEYKYFNLITKTKFDTNKCAEILHSKISSIETLEIAKNYIQNTVIDDEVYGTKKFEELKIRCLHLDGYTEDNPLTILKNQIKQYIEHTHKESRRSNIEELDYKIKSSINTLQKLISDISTGNKNFVDTSLDEIHYDIFSNDLYITNKFSNLPAEELNNMILVSNIILKNTRHNGLSERDTILNIVREVGSIFSKGNKETLLFQYLNNDINSYNIDKISNSVFKNFVAFILNIDSIEKLENFLEMKDIEEEWISFSFWGAFNGFSNLSGNFTDSVFNKGGESIQFHMDTYINNNISIINNKDVFLNYSIDESEKTIEHKLLDNIHNIYKNLIHNKFNISPEEFFQILSVPNEQLFYEQLKKLTKINKKDAVELYNIIRRQLDFPLLFE